MSRIAPDDGARLPRNESDSTMGTLFGVMAHRPEIMQQAAQLLDVTMRGGTVDAKLKELLAVRVSQVNSCLY